MKRTIVVLGAADGSMSTYRTAREMDLRTVAVDWSPGAPGVELADEYLALSTRDVDGITAALAGREIAGVIAPCSDIALPTVRELRIRLGLPAELTDLAVRASADKSVMRSLLDELGVPVYRWIDGDDPAELAHAAKQFGFPQVVKPVDAQGGRGVSRCTRPEDLVSALQDAKERSYGGNVMIEEEVQGTHVSAECIIDHGHVVFMATTRQTLSAPPLALTLAHRMPADLPSKTDDRISAIVNALCTRTGYRRGPLNLDLVISPRQTPYVIEAGFRTGGNGMDDLVRRCYGVDPIRAALQSALGLSIELNPQVPSPVMWRVLTADRAGELISVSGALETASAPTVADLVLLTEPGRRVKPYTEVSDRLGWVLLRAESPGALDEAAAGVDHSLRFEVRPCPDDSTAGRELFACSVDVR